MSRILRAGALTFCCLLYFPPLEHGASAQDGRSFVVGVEQLDYLPAYGVEEGAYTGYARDLLDAFAADAGYDFEYRPMPVPRLFASLLAGTVDFKYPDSPNWSRSDKEGHEIAYSAPAMVHIDGTVVARARDPESIETLGTVTGFTAWAWLDRIDRGELHLVENADLTSLIRQVLAGRVDGAYANVAVVKHQLDTVLEQPDSLIYRSDLPFDRGTYHLSTTLHPEVIAAFDAWLEANAERVAEMQRAYGVDEPAELLPR